MKEMEEGYTVASFAHALSDSTVSRPREDFADPGLHFD